MTTYRDRHLAGQHTDPNPPKPPEKPWLKQAKTTKTKPKSK